MKPIHIGDTVRKGTSGKTLYTVIDVDGDEVTLQSGTSLIVTTTTKLDTLTVVDSLPSSTTET